MSENKGIHCEKTLREFGGYNNFKEIHYKKTWRDFGGYNKFEKWTFWMKRKINYW